MIRIVTCGHIKEKWLKDGIQEYFKRITAYDKIEIIEVDDEKYLIVRQGEIMAIVE